MILDVELETASPPVKAWVSINFVCAQTPLAKASAVTIADKTALLYLIKPSRI
jgi:hypothetical protein